MIIFLDVVSKFIHNQYYINIMHFTNITLAALSFLGMVLKLYTEMEVDVVWLYKPLKLKVSVK